MIHTAQLLIPLSQQEILIRETRYGVPSEKRNIINEILYSQKIIGVTGKEYYSDTLNSSICSFIIDIPKLLNRGTVFEDDYWIIKKRMESILGMLYGDVRLFEQHNLIRIDYRIDVQVPNIDLHSLYLELYKKTREKYRHLQKTIEGEYEASIYHKCKSIETVLYSKELEAIAKKRTLDYWEKGIMRYEVRLKNDHLYYHCRKHSLDKKLITFFEKEKFDFYLENYLYKIFPQGDFYSFDSALTLISKANCTPTLKERLKQFVRKVSNGALDTPTIKTYPGHISKQSWQKRINLFNELNINPITIPAVYKIKVLPNLLNRN